MFNAKSVMIFSFVVAGACFAVGMSIPEQRGGVSAMMFWFGFIFIVIGGVIAILRKEKTESPMSTSCAHPDHRRNN